MREARAEAASVEKMEEARERKKALQVKTTARALST